MKRIAGMILFKEEDLNKIDNLISLTPEKLCKVPCFIHNREEMDTLPFHLTLSVWDILEKNKVESLFSSIELLEIELRVNDIKIKESNFNGGVFFNLHLAIEENLSLRKIQNYIYQKLPNEKYNPEHFIIHITLACHEDYHQLFEIKKNLLKNFKPFKIKSSRLVLYEIYPANLIEVKG